MSRITFIIVAYGLVLPQLAMTQDDSFRLGFQSGNTLSLVTIQQNNLVKAGWFLGNSLGLTSRTKLGQLKFRWASFSGRPELYLDLGIIHAHRGYDYQLAGHSQIKRYNHWLFPVLLIIKPEQKIFYRKWRRRQLFWNSKVGFQLNYHPRLNHNRSLQSHSGATTARETTILSRKANFQFVGGLGLQKTSSRGGLSYFGIGFHSGLINILQTSISPVQGTSINPVNLFWRGSYVSFDVQFYPGKWPRLTNRLPPVIYNPRNL